MSDTINGRDRAAEIPIQTKPLDFDPYTPPASPDVPKDAVPDQAPQPAAEPDVDDEQQDQTPDEPRRYFHRVRVVAMHKHTRTVVRQGAYVVAGVMHARKGRRDERSTARHHRMMTAAETVGDHEKALEWEERAHRHRAERHRRRMELLKTAPMHVAHALVTSAIVVAGTLVVLGVILAASSKQASDVVRPMLDAAAFVRLVAQVIAVLFWPTVMLAPVAVLASLWSLGRRRAEMPAWLAPQGMTQGPANTNITPSMVVVALRDLGITALRSKIKEMQDGAAALLGPITIAGIGREVDVYLPSGVSTTDILDRHQKLAENLGRHRHELYITIPERARTVRLWIADIGALDETIDASPLVTDPDIVANWFTGAAPWGVDLRRDPVGFRPKQRHVVLTGLSNHGKTFALRALALWCAFDACVEFLIADLKGVGDWSMFGDGLATELIEGPADRHVIAATHMVEGAVEEMERRIEKAGSLGLKDGIPEGLARKPGSGFHPLMVIVDEAQRAIMCPAVDEDKNPYGGLTNKGRFLSACRNLQNQGRAVNVVLYLGTQDPTPQNFPLMLRNSAHLRASLPLGSKGQSEMVLGKDAVDAGAAPHRLRRGVDKGVVVAFGEGLDFPTGQAHMTVWTHFVDGEAAHLVADRAKARRKAVATRTGRAGEQNDLPKLDVLADVAAVIGSETRVLKQEVMLRLAERDDRYREFTDARLKAELEAAGAPQYTYNGVTHVHGDRVREALAQRFSATD